MKELHWSLKRKTPLTIILCHRYNMETLQSPEYLHGLWYESSDRSTDGENHAKLWLIRRVSPHLQVNTPNRTHPSRWRLVHVLVEVSSRLNPWTANDRSKRKNILLVNCSGHWSCVGVSSSSSSSLLLFGSDISSLSLIRSPLHSTREKEIL